MPIQPNFIQPKILLLVKGPIILCTTKKERKKGKKNTCQLINVTVLSHIPYKSDFREVIM